MYIYRHRWIFFSSFSVGWFGCDAQNMPKYAKAIGWYLCSDPRGEEVEELPEHVPDSGWGQWNVKTHGQCLCVRSKIAGRSLSKNRWMRLIHPQISFESESFPFRRCCGNPRWLMNLRYVLIPNDGTIMGWMTLPKKTMFWSWHTLSLSAQMNENVLS